MARQEQEEHTKRWCALPEPYPKPMVVQPNLYYAQLLLEDYAGSLSEMTAINQYSYHYLMFVGEYEEIAHLEACIAIIEMYHLELLGETIKLLGVEPKYRTITGNCQTFWDASHVFYGTGLYDRLAADIAAEKLAIKQYRTHQGLISDKYINILLERIIKDEEHHLKLFLHAAARFCPDLFRNIDEEKPGNA
ncbi:ferritin-like domain-containing protein [Anaeroselena agilis]|uniref:Ferritin-like domain-containing protein n=1 Tax=Anaeroselena agilis TaxID=3063788 RepID=A0ABU3NT52_9FIRM|nr:ferritin-like domain-containing protein [Selenomonadales bacterium 4137-cl]